MPSQKRRKTQKNPLAHARGHQKAPENLWFKRSGAGFRLFVEYYTQQPEGVIASIFDMYFQAGMTLDQCTRIEPMTETSTTTSTNTNTTSQNTNIKGMSRAAKRRRKKRGESEVGIPATTRLQATDTTQQPATDPDPLSSELLTVATSSALVKAYQLPFFQIMSKPLPTTFRIRRYPASDDEHVERTTSFLQRLSEFQDIVQPIPFSLKNEIFQSQLPKWQLPQPLKDLLLEYSQNGVLARQELGSMLPVMVLPIKVGDCVVDMCASPGSKTLQALEHCCGRRHPSRHGDSNGGSIGLVLANDVLQTRLDSLRGAVDRSGVLSSDRIQYSQVDATQLTLSSPCDAVICDVPCSGDGTCRKDVHILPMWKPASGNTLHGTQLAILKRSLELVKVGGYVCYSTCSLNPVEDEAVVAAALVTFGDTIELVKITNLMERNEWIHRPGVHSWKVAHYVEGKTNSDPAFLTDDDTDEIPKLTWYPSYDTAKEDAMDGAVESLWSNDSTKSLPLERCVRLFPQDFNSGGFFLALFRKIK